MPCGLGEPFFDSFESILSHLLFSIPAVKAVSFGDEDMIYKTLNDELDELKYINNEISYLANHQGGILGGITNGNVIKFATTFKAPASTTSSKQSVNLKTGENILVSTEGRHDPIIGIRAIPVINSICYYAILDLLLEVKKI